MTTARPIIAVDRHAAATYVRRHPDQIRRRCLPIGTGLNGRALYDLAEVEATFRDTPRRTHLTRG